MMSDIDADGGARPRVSVALCTYNGARHLEEQLASIAAQTDLPEELVVQDDGSTDATVQMLARFAPAFPVRVHLNSRQLGAAANFSTCIERCTGDVVLLSDQDDVWADDRVARTRAAFATDPRLALTYSDAPLIDEEGAAIGRSIFGSVPIRADDRRRLATGDDLLKVILRYGVLYGATMAFRRSVAHAALPVPPGWSHDEWTSLVASVLGSAARLDPVIGYRQHASQVVGAGNARLSTLVKSARDRGAGHYDAEIDRLASGIAAARRDRLLGERLLPLLEQKLAFLMVRRAIHGGGPGDLPKLIGQLVGGGYHRFAGGSRSVVKDVLVLARLHANARRHRTGP